MYGNCYNDFYSDKFELAEIFLSSLYSENNDYDYKDKTFINNNITVINNNYNNFLKELIILYW